MFSWEYCTTAFSIEHIWWLILELRHLFCLWHIQLWKFIKIAWHKHNLMISSSAVSGHAGKNSYEIPHEYLSGWGNLSWEIIRIEYNHQSNLRFFSNIDFPSSLLPSPNFFRTALFLQKLHSSYFFRVTTLTQQLLFRSSYFFTTASFLRSSFFRTITFSHQLFFQNSFFFRVKLLQSSHFLRKGSY